MDISGSEAIWVRVSPDGHVESVVLRYTSGGATASTSNRTATAVGGITVRMPFAWKPLYSLSQDGLRATLIRALEDGGDAGTFRATVVSTWGDTVFSREYPFERTPIPKEVADSAIEATARKWQASNPELAAAIRKEAQVPPFYPPIQTVTNGRDGTIWIGLRETPEGRPYVVLDATGRPYGTVLLPLRTVVRVADRRNIWAVESDENDVQSIVRYRIVRQ